MRLSFIKIFVILGFLALSSFAFAEKAEAQVIQNAPNVTGYVRTESLAGIEGVWVRWTDNMEQGQGARHIRYARTDANGRYRFESWQDHDGWGQDQRNGQYALRIDTNLDGTTDDRMASTESSAAFGCGQNPHEFTAVVPYNWSGTFSVVVVGVEEGDFSNDIPDLGLDPIIWTPNFGRITGYKVLMPGNLPNPLINAQIVTLNSQTASSNPYFFDHLNIQGDGVHTVSVSPFQGYEIGYTLCFDAPFDICHNSSPPTLGNSVNINYSQFRSVGGQTISLWWHYTPVSPRINALRISSATTPFVTGTYGIFGKSVAQGGLNWLNPMKIILDATPGTETETQKTMYYVGIYSGTQLTNRDTFVNDLKARILPDSRNGVLLAYTPYFAALAGPLWAVFDPNATNPNETSPRGRRGDFVAINAVPDPFRIGYLIYNGTNLVYTVKLIEDAGIPGRPRSNTWRIDFDQNFGSKLMYTAVEVIDALGQIAFNEDITPTP